MENDKKSLWIQKDSDDVVVSVSDGVSDGEVFRPGVSIEVVVDVVDVVSIVIVGAVVSMKFERITSERERWNAIDFDFGFDIAIKRGSEYLWICFSIGKDHYASYHTSDTSDTSDTYEKVGNGNVNSGAIFRAVLKGVFNAGAWASGSMNMVFNRLRGQKKLWM